MNMVKKHLTLEDCMTLSDAGYEIYINDGLAYTNYEESDDNSAFYHKIPDDLATPTVSAFS